MTKQLIITLFFGCLISSCCLAQSAAKVLPAIKSEPPKPMKKSVIKEGRKTPVPKADNKVVNVHFFTNENCSLRVNGQAQGLIVKGNRKTVRLEVGEHKLTFESTVPGKTIDSTFKLTTGMAKAGTYTYTVTFKNNLADSGKLVKTDTLQNNGNVSVTIKGRDSANRAMDTAKTHVEDVKRSIALATIQELSTNMVLLSGGSFIMGVIGGKVKELLPHTVMIDPVNFGKYEVTQKQWNTIMGYNNSGNEGCSSCPVENVSWNEVDSFIAKINNISSKARFRLPTEAEWEYAAKKAIENEMKTSNNTDGKVEDLIEQTDWYFKNSEGKTHSVGSKNPLSGIYDLLGNVAEWCLDYYRPDYQKDHTNNPNGPSIGKEKLVKGGSYGSYMDKDELKPAVRNKENPSTRKNTIGFRLVMEANLNAKLL